ncbi:hypothetical protein WH96_03790 [Kiloniella spongiae]|uniref:Uncharacterized protein n=1 Tax=Kiloniella spongiae TaxID=1489064 RepID=A0A0H2MJ74_9PROT|nr:hypothetical protein WH96_03790 [Kiloniella spongiae]
MPFLISSSGVEPLSGATPLFRLSESNSKYPVTLSNVARDYGSILFLNGHLWEDNFQTLSKKYIDLRKICDQITFLYGRKTWLWRFSTIESPQSLNTMRLL